MTLVVHKRPGGFQSLGLLTVCAGLLLSRHAFAEDSDSAKGMALFESKIRPVLVTHCYSCHSSEKGKSEGSLLLDSRDGMRNGGDRGPAVVPGKPDESLLLIAISHADSDLKMPPKVDRLPNSVIDDFKTWIRLGAPDPRAGSGLTSRKTGIDLEAARKFWSFQRPVKPNLPEIHNASWPKRDLDYFILAKLEAAGLEPSADADPTTLLRRVHFDIIGMPPGPAAITEFLAQVKSRGIDMALEAEVNSLLASPAYSERWARHWLDVARFAESSGKSANISFPYAWRYRDYVIDCFNVDMPYDRFLVEQVAGDLLPYDDDKERARLLIATGFLAVGPKNLDEGNKLQFAADIVDEQIDAVTQAVLASSVACARCHDHKFDPFSMEDYYALAGIFSSTKAYFGTMVSPANQVGGDPLPLPRIEGQKIFHKPIPAAQVSKLNAELASLKKEKPKTLRDALRIFWRTGAIEGQLEIVDETGKPLPLTMGALDREKIQDAPLLARGDVGRPGERIPRNFPRVIQLNDVPPVPAKQSGRLELAQWLVHPDNPLTARVMANRIWHHLLGAGIVQSVDNFGVTGEKPSHPELLDHLAVRFVANGWSIKKMVREITLSRTYRQSSTYREKPFLADPDNRLLWRVSKRRLDAEAIRDAMLVASGELDPTRPPGSLVAQQIGDRPISLIGLDSRIPADLDASRHRSIYLPVLRDRLPDVLDLFDFAEPSLVTGARDTTNVPVQALYLMNSPFVQARAEALAGRLLKETDNPHDRIQRAFLLCFGRTADSGELDAATRYFEKTLPQGSDAANSEQQGKVFASYCQALLATAEFRNID